MGYRPTTRVARKKPWFSSEHHSHSALGLVSTWMGDRLGKQGFVNIRSPRCQWTSFMTFGAHGRRSILFFYSFCTKGCKETPSHWKCESIALLLLKGLFKVPSTILRGKEEINQALFPCPELQQLRSAIWWFLAFRLRLCFVSFIWIPGETWVLFDEWTNSVFLISCVWIRPKGVHVDFERFLGKFLIIC